VGLPLPARGSGLQLRVLGFPVSVHPSFFLLAAILAFSGGLTLTEIAIWIVLVAVSVLVHELGHAVVARRFGAAPEIDLYGLGGVTRYSADATPTRARSVAVAVAGPATGIVLGLLLLAYLFAGPRYDEGSTTQFVLAVAIYVNLGWGALNLLPVLPLDGGQVMASLLPGDPVTRLRRAAVVSVVTGAAAAVAAAAAGLTFGAVLAAWFAASNLSGVFATRASDRDAALVADLQAADRALTDRRGEDALALTSRAIDRARDPQLRHLALTVHALALLETGDPRAAMRAALDAAELAPVDPTLEAVLLVATGQTELGRDRLAAIRAAGSGWPPALRAADRLPLA
jgi:Zn-dependent protease